MTGLSCPEMSQEDTIQLENPRALRCQPGPWLANDWKILVALRPDNSKIPRFQESFYKPHASDFFVMQVTCHHLKKKQTTSNNKTSKLWDHSLPWGSGGSGANLVEFLRTPGREMAPWYIKSIFGRTVAITSACCLNQSISLNIVDIPLMFLNHEISRFTLAKKNFTTTSDCFPWFSHDFSPLTCSFFVLTSDRELRSANSLRYDLTVFTVTSSTTPSGSLLPDRVRIASSASSVAPNLSSAAPVQLPLRPSFSRRTDWMGPKGEKME